MREQERINKLTTSLIDTNTRIPIVSKSFKAFILYYLRDKFSLAPADYHIDLINKLQYLEEFLGIIGYRGCSKTTLIEAFALWRFITKQSKTIVIIGGDDEATGQILRNIKEEIENNIKLQQDFNIPVRAKNQGIETSKWSEKHIRLNECSIIVKAKYSRIRGKKIGKFRPDLILIDDLEDVEESKTQKTREKTREWVYSSVIPAGDSETKVVMIGNLVHQDCVLARLYNQYDLLAKGEIEKDELIGTDIIKIPMFIGDGTESVENINWKAKFPDQEAIDKEKRKVFKAGIELGNVIWQREYMLKNISIEEQIIKYEDIKYYDNPTDLPSKEQGTYGMLAHGVDLAISEKETADYTSLVSGLVYKSNIVDKHYIFISENVINKRLSFKGAVETIKEVYNVNHGMNSYFFIENVGYQQAVVEEIQAMDIPCEGIKPNRDKRARLNLVSYFVKDGTVLFPRKGAEKLIEQLVNFGVAPHDDMVDAFCYCVLGGNTSVGFGEIKFI